MARHPAALEPAQLVMAVAIPLFQQFTNVIMFYALVLFKTLGFGGSASLMSAVITGLINFAATFVSGGACCSCRTTRRCWQTRWPSVPFSA